MTARRQGDSGSSKPTAVIVAGTVVAVLWVLQWIVLVAFRADLSSLGLIGDSFAALNTLFSGAALVGVVIAIIYQSRELELQRHELADTREVLERTREEHAGQVRLAADSIERERVRFTLEILEERANRESYLRSKAAHNVLLLANQSSENMTLLVSVYTDTYPNPEFERVFSLDVGGSIDNSGRAMRRNADQDLHDLDFVLRKWHLWLSAAKLEVVRSELIAEQFRGTWAFWLPVLRPFLTALRAKGSEGAAQLFPWITLDHDWERFLGKERRSE